MDFHQLFVFTKVVEHKSFSKAAEDIFLSQSTVSSHIQSLEKMLNVRLFDRVGRDIILTPHGERLYQWALKLLLLKDEALLDLNEGMAEFRGSIRMAASSVPGQFIIPKMVKQFREAYPAAAFNISQFPSKAVADKVLSGTVDVGLLGAKYENEKLAYFPLLKEKLVLVTHKDITLDEPVSIHAVKKYPLVMRHSDSGTNTMLEHLFKKAGILKEQLNIIAYTDSGQSLIQFIRQGIGISIMSEIAARDYAEHQMVNMYELAGLHDERFFYLVYNKAKTLPLISKLFVDFASIGGFRLAEAD
ncbi:selenium metabolism-associated LysR family transcriptional regulator [Bacillus sp. B-jedd]|uniref:selenium metabolism-associated LysR family transcriptional regulator n=1 Tax=Bacillus sp. B-jedd TaxID=1476857 RepID=UPI000515626C|nr:selenium metabolism-associated LysR family transcriptional regulator [Bacillus sp. B-jedd]CEG28329.1 LysR family transcriptional regulator [Bacillus sp. B-jedd]